MVEYLLAGRPAGAVSDFRQRLFAVKQFRQKEPGIDGGQMVGFYGAATTGLRLFQFPAIVPAAARAPVDEQQAVEAGGHWVTSAGKMTGLAEGQPEGQGFGLCNLLNHRKI